MRLAVDRPGLVRGDERFLHGVFGKFEVTEPTGERSNDAGSLLAPRSLQRFGLHGHLSVSTVSVDEPGMIGRISTLPIRALGTLAAHSSATSRLSASIT